MRLKAFSKISHCSLVNAQRRSELWDFGVMFLVPKSYEILGYGSSRYARVRKGCGHVVFCVILNLDGTLSGYKEWPMEWSKLGETTLEVITSHFTAQQTNRLVVARIPLGAFQSRIWDVGCSTIQIWIDGISMKHAGLTPLREPLYRLCQHCRLMSLLQLWLVYRPIVASCGWWVCLRAGKQHASNPTLELSLVAVKDPGCLRRISPSLHWKGILVDLFLSIVIGDEH